MIKLGKDFPFKFYCGECNKQSSQLIITDKDDYIKIIKVQEKCKNCNRKYTYYKYCEECLSDIENIDIWRDF